MPPAEFSVKHFSSACAGLLRSHAHAYQIIHSEIQKREGPWKNWPLQVGIAHNMIDFVPDRWWHGLDYLLARVLHRLYNRSWLDAVTGKKPHFGVPGILPEAEPVGEALEKKTADFIGLNYYTKAYVLFRPRDSGHENSADVPIGLSFARRTEPASDLDWAIHPEGLEKMLRIASGYSLPIYITENGIADRDDSRRSDYLHAHINVIHRLKNQGMDIRGYYHWSLLDNFEWIKGFWPRFGLYQVNYETFERTQTASAKTYSQLIQQAKFQTER